MVHRLLITTGLAVVAILRIIGNALYQPDDGERISTWSIRKRDARIFFLLLFGLWIAAAVGLSVAQYASEPPRMLQWATPPPHVGDGSAYAVTQRFGGIVVPLMAVALVLTSVVRAAGRTLMGIVRYIDEKILIPFVEAKAVAPRLETRLAEITAEVTANVTAEVTDAITAAVTAEATAAVTARTDEQWADWLVRRDAALAQGLEFNEPRPDEISLSER